ncbi:MAG: NADH-quinone oxidoreductase subunit NuoE [Pseudomonadota bacterium]
MPIEFNNTAKQKLDELIARYPNPQAACLPALHLAQQELGCLSPDALRAVAEYLKLPLVHVYGVATFYTMFHREKVGKNVLMVCTNISCMLRGADDILKYLEERLGIKPGETTADGAFTLIEEECLAACANGPAMICGTDYQLDLTREKVDRALDELGHTRRADSAVVAQAAAATVEQGGSPVANHARAGDGTEQSPTSGCSKRERVN